MLQDATSRIVRYHGGETPVKIGDHIELPMLVFFFIKKPGRVVYVPGISKVHSEMEFNGLAWVGIDFDDGTRTGVLVDPETHCLQKNLIFFATDRW